MSAHVRSFCRRFVQYWARFRCHPSIFHFSFIIFCWNCVVCATLRFRCGNHGERLWQLCASSGSHIDISFVRKYLIKSECMEPWLSHDVTVEPSQFEMNQSWIRREVEVQPAPLWPAARLVSRKPECRPRSPHDLHMQHMQHYQWSPLDHTFFGPFLSLVLCRINADFFDQGHKISAFFEI